MSTGKTGTSAERRSAAAANWRQQECYEDSRAPGPAGRIGCSCSWPRNACSRVNSLRQHFGIGHTIV